MQIHITQGEHTSFALLEKNVLKLNYENNKNCA